MNGFLFQISVKLNEDNFLDVVLISLLSFLASNVTDFSPGDEPRNFYDRLTYWVEN